MADNLPGDSITPWNELDFVELGPSMVSMVVARGMTPAVAAVELPPNAVTPRHSHSEPRIEVVIQGEFSIDGRVQHVGDIRVLDANVKYGPNQAGPEGCRILEFFPSPEDFLAIPDDEAAAASGANMDEVNQRFQAMVADARKRSAI